MKPLSGETTPAAQRRKPVNGRHRRWPPYAGAALLILLLGLGLWPRPIPVEIAQVTVGPLRTTVDEEGKTRVKERFAVSAPVSGQLRRIELKPGADIQAGYTVLAQLDPVSPTLLDVRSRTQSEAKRDTARANLEKARSAHSFAKNELSRFQRLYDEKALSLQELEPVQWRETAAARDEAAAESALRQAEAELAEFGSLGDGPAARRTPVEVKAPVNGRVLRVFEESARVVTAGTPLVEVGDPSDLEVVIEVLSRDAAAIVPGATVDLEQWGGESPLHARVRLVEPAAFTKVSALGVEEQRVRVIADLLAPPEVRRGLGDYFRVEARIVTWESDHVRKVPAGALFRRGDGWAVFTFRDGVARLRAVKVGHSSGSQTEILDGLNEGEAVILYPGDRVRDGQKVAAIKI